MKPEYRIRYWSEYNARLTQRGNLTLWTEESMLEQWVLEELSAQAGASVVYSDFVMQTMATVKAVYRLAGPQCQGFLESIFESMGIALTVPNHPTLSRRRGQFSIELPIVPRTGACHVVVDSIGVVWRRRVEHPTP